MTEEIRAFPHGVCRNLPRGQIMPAAGGKTADELTPIFSGSEDNAAGD
jgi:hypothetical protein